MEIKIGQKLVNIRTFVVKDEYEDTIHTFNIGDLISITSIGGDSMYPYYTDVKPYTDDKKVHINKREILAYFVTCNVIEFYIEYKKYPVFVQFSDGSYEQYSCDEINEYFQNMAEWREKQIDEILND